VRLQILEQLNRFRSEVALTAIDAPLLVGLAANDTAMRAWKEEGAVPIKEIRPDADMRWYESRHDIPLIRPDEVARDVEELARRATRM
jgi:hypothetical protein